MIARGMLDANTKEIAASAYSAMLNFWNFLNFAFNAEPLSVKACMIFPPLYNKLFSFYRKHT
jgi:hypothetical protein